MQSYSSLFHSINAIRQPTKHDPHLRQLLLPHELMRGEDDRCFLLLLRLLGDAFGAVAVQGGLGSQETAVGLWAGEIWGRPAPACGKERSGDGHR